MQTIHWVTLALTTLAASNATAQTNVGVDQDGRLTGAPRLVCFGGEY